MTTISTVFVYGTLRKGGVREMPLLFPHMAFHGFGHIRGLLYDFGAYPGVLLIRSVQPHDQATSPTAHSVTSSQLGDAILGEVYDVDETVLARLDAIEEFFPGNPAGSYYFRVPVTVQMRNGTTRICWVYEFNPALFETRAPIRSGDWIAHAAAKGTLPEERWPDGEPLMVSSRSAMKTITPDSLYSLIELSDVRISPDGTRVVFVRSQPDQTGNSYSRSIWIKDLNSDTPAEPLSASTKDSTPRWSPDGSRLAFLSGREGDAKIYVLPQRGEARMAVSHATPIKGFEWSADGQRFVFATDNRADQRDLEDVAARAENPAESPKASAIEARHAKERAEQADKDRFDPRVITRVPYRNGAGVSYFDDKTQQLYVADAPAHFRETHAVKTRRLTQMDANHGAAVWAKDGSAVFSTLTREPDNARLYAYHDLVRIPVGAESPQPLTRMTGAGYSCFEPKISPDGRWVAFTRSKEERLGHHVTTLAVVPTDGGDAVDLTGDVDRTVRDFVWDRNSEYLYFSVESEGALNLYRVTVPAAVALDAELRNATIPTSIRGRLVEDLRLSDRVASGLRRVGVRTVGDLLEFWEQGGTLQDDVQIRIEPITTGNLEISSFDVDVSGRVVFVASTGKDISALYVREANGMVRTLYEPNGAFGAGYALGTFEALKYTSDLYTIQGWVVYPPNFDANAKYPLAVNIHGGPHLQWSPGTPSLFAESQLLASNGYIVFYCNPRGSTGYGETFTAANWRDWSDGPMRDIMRGVDAVIARGAVDESRMAITGGSYGGFMTAWIISHSDRFCAAVAQRGVYNLLSMRNTADVPIFIDFEMGLTPWDDAPLLWDRSPIAHVKNVNTPLLIEHSENDYRVPIEQAEQLFQALALLKKQVEFVRFPREGHELSRNGEPRHRVERLRRIMAWFDQFCK